MKYYTMVYEICIQKDSNYCELLYSNITKLISQFILNNLQLRTNEGEEGVAQESDSADFESSEDYAKIALLIIEYWIRYNNFIKILNGIFSYLNRFYVQLSLQPNIYQYSLAIFQLYIFQRYKGCVRRYLLNLLDRRRVGDEINNLHVTLIIDMYKKLDSTNGLQFLEDLEPYIINNYSNYYNAVSKVYINDFALSDFITIIDSILKDEVKYYNTHISNNNKVHDVIINNLLYNNQSRIKEKLQNELRELLEQYRIEDLKLIYKYVSKLENVNEIITNTLTQFVEHLVKTSMANSGTISDPSRVGHDVIFVYNKYLKLIKSCFEMFLNSYNSIFTKYNNSELLTHIVTQLHRILMDNFDTELAFDVEDPMDLDASSEFLDINCYIKYYNNVIVTDESFLRSYKAYLLKRMLNDRINITNEVNVLRNPVINTILGDFKRSKSMNTSYQSATSVAGNIYVLSSFNLSDVLDNSKPQSYLGDSQSVENSPSENLRRSGTPRVFGTIEVSEGVQLNPIFSHELESYRTYYKENNKFKDLRYVYTNVILEYGTTTIECNIIQATLLLLFNDTDELKMEEVCEQLNIREKQVEKLVNSCKPILTLTMNTIMLSDNLSENININPCDPVKVLSEIESGALAKLNDELGANMRLQDESTIDCKIVKTMKDRKTLNLKELIELVSQQSIDPEVVRLRINYLVSKEYINVQEEVVTYIP
ncbi:Cullin family protein [Theileria parva strain Muguga]|uniref:Cullin family protein n=1 Tax=Theileria parva strain Muguga TaxID=333668 RepID=UPI001C621F51|nr:Cullin family protein [Theileria parva strain Muguga]EAN31946.2 Cullin family protein [Theileria parva strain Muguga]